jgi:UDP-N-acetyl-D-mannosaminuronic acid transferase (WecB/TagA/CpsF family)
MNTFQLSTGVAEILGVKVNLVNYSQTIASMEEAIKYRSTLTISFVNVHSIMTSQRWHCSKQLLMVFSSVPDGMPLVWISNGPTPHL